MTTALTSPSNNSVALSNESATIIGQIGQPGCPKLTAALASARDRCKAASKDARNVHHNYAYASADAVIATASDAMAESGLALIPVREEMAIMGTAQLSWYVLHRTLILTHSSGEFLPLEIRGFPIVVERGRPLDKAYLIALTSSLAYKLRDLLQMPRGTNSDVAAQDDTQTPIAVTPAPAQIPVPDPNALAPATAPSPAIVTAEQADALSALALRCKRSTAEVQVMLASLSAPVLARLPEASYPTAWRLLAEGQIQNTQLDRIAETLRSRNADHEKVAQWLQQKYGVSRLRLLSLPQAKEVEEFLARQPAPAKA